MGALTKTLYDTDFVEWAKRTAELLREGRLDEVELDQVAQEIDDLRKNQERAARSSFAAYWSI